MDTNGKQRNSSFKPFIMGAALGALGGMLGMYLYQSRQPTPLPEPKETAAPAVDCSTVEQKAAEPTVRPSKDPEDYEFYGVLEKVPVTPTRPDLEQPLPPPPTEGSRSAPAPAAPDTHAPSRPIYLQVASFKAPADADALKARIVLAGAQAAVVAMDIPDKGTYYRVRVGPFASQDELAKAKAQLGQGGIDLNSAFVVR